MTSPREVIQKGSKSFALASLFFPNKIRADVYVLYAWLRHCDDVIDAPKSTIEDLSNLRSNFLTNDNHPESKQLRRLIAEKKLPLEYFHEFFEGLKMDLENKGYQTVLDLELYCYRVAGVIGLMMCPLMGTRHDQALKHAQSLGMGMQLTNICRDVAEDAKNNRVYLPQQLFEQTVSAENLSDQPELSRKAVLNLLSRAEEFYIEGNAGLKYLPFRMAIAVGSASFIYRQIGHKITQKSSALNTGRIFVSNFEKVKCICVGFYFAIKSRFESTKK